MSMKLATPPATALAAVAGALDHLQTRNALAMGGGGPTRGPRALARVGHGRLTAAAPHPVYTLTLEQLARGAGLQEAQLVGWRYLLEDDGGRVLGFAETTPEQGGGAPVTLRALGTGGGAQAVRDALVDLEARDLGDHDRELRLLRVPALSIAALWLAAPGGDLMAVLPPAPGELPPRLPLTADAVLARLRPLAQARLQFPG